MLKKVIVCSLAILVLGSSLFFLKDHFSRSFHHWITPSTNLSFESINGVSLFDMVDLPKEKSRDNDLYNYYHFNEGIEVATNSYGEIVRFMITAGTKTVGGVGVGDTIDKIRQLTVIIIIEDLNKGSISSVI